MRAGNSPEALTVISAIGSTTSKEGEIFQQFGFFFIGELFA
jgi:hypothetical protein